MPTANRGYFQVTAGVPPSEQDLNDNLIDKIDADVQQNLDDIAQVSSDVSALKIRVDATISDQGANSQIIAVPPEFQQFSTGSNALDPGNTPQYVDGGTFTVTSDWTGEFITGRRLEVTPGPVRVYVSSSSYSSAQNRTTIQVWGGTLPNPITDVGLSGIKYGAPQIINTDIFDGTIGETKLAFDPARQDELDAVDSNLSSQISSVQSSLTTAQNDLNTHAAATSDVHGVTSPDTLETASGADTKIATHDADANAHPTVVATLQATSEKNQPNGYCGLDANGKIATAQLPGVGLKSVQRGQTTIGAGVTIADSAAFTAVDQAKAFWIISYRGDQTQEDRVMVTAEFLSNTQLRFTRNTGTGTVTVSWQVVEFY